MNRAHASAPSSRSAEALRAIRLDCGSNQPWSSMRIFASITRLPSWTGDSETQGLYGSYGCASLLLRSAKSLAAWYERKHNLLPAILPARNRPAPDLSGAARPALAAFEPRSGGDCPSVFLAFYVPPKAGSKGTRDLVLNSFTSVALLVYCRFSPNVTMRPGSCGDIDCFLVGAVVMALASPLSMRRVVRAQRSLHPKAAQRHNKSVLPQITVAKLAGSLAGRVQRSGMAF
jgi:hypothetical protein